MFYATIRHHSISRAPVVRADTLSAAKQAAISQFGDGFRDHEMIIVEEFDDRAPVIVARRKIGGARHWTHCEIDA